MTTEKDVEYYENKFDKFIDHIKKEINDMVRKGNQPETETIQGWFIDGAKLLEVLSELGVVLTEGFYEERDRDVDFYKGSIDTLVYYIKMDIREASYYEEFFETETVVEWICEYSALSNILAEFGVA